MVRLFSLDSIGLDVIDIFLDIVEEVFKFFSISDDCLFIGIFVRDFLSFGYF